MSAKPAPWAKAPCATAAHRSRHYLGVDGRQHCAVCEGAAWYRQQALVVPPAAAPTHKEGQP